MKIFEESTRIMTREEEILQVANENYSGYSEITLTDEFETAFRQAMEGGAE